MKCATSFGLALVCAFAIGAQAQEQETKSKTKTRVEGDKAQTVMFTGCVQSGADTHAYILNKVVPVSQSRTTEVTGTGGTVTTTSTTYMLVPGERVELQSHVGHKVEVTGVLIPAGDSKTRTKTTIEREHGKDTKIDEKTKRDNDHPQLRVLSVRSLSEPCM